MKLIHDLKVKVLDIMALQNTHTRRVAADDLLRLTRLLGEASELIHQEIWQQIWMIRYAIRETDDML